MTHRIIDKLNFGIRLLLAVGGVVALTPQVCALAQSERLAFEVASVKPSTDTDFRNIRREFLPGGKVVMRNVPLMLIVATAYDLPFQSPRLAGGPEWEHVKGDRYDIEATAEKGAIPASLSTRAREDKIRLMLQSLLQDRFKLKMRRDPKEQPVYALIVAKGGPKLAKSKMQEKDCVDAPSSFQTGCHTIGGGQGRGIHGAAVSVADVSLFVQNWSDRPVVDKTGLTDLYNIQTEGWVPMRQRPPGPDGTPQGGGEGLDDPDRQTLSGIFSQLGIRMEPQRAVVDMFVVEYVERPSGN